MNRNLRIVVSIVAMLVIASLCHTAEIWTEDFDAAIKKAKEEKKDLLIDFTGSDWCKWCVTLDKEVFNTDKFKAEAPKSFVLVKLDFPRRTPQDPEIKKKNSQLQQKYQVRGFPTILLVDETGVAYASTGYQAGGPEAYLKHLNGLRAGKAEMQEIQKKIIASEGLEKAKLLDQLINYKTSRKLPVDDKLYKEICELDADGKAGLKKKYEGLMLIMELDGKIKALLKTGKIKEVFKLIDQTTASEKLLPAQKQGLLMGAAKLSMQTRNIDGALKYAKQAFAVDPKGPSAARIGMAIKQIEAAKANAAGGAPHSPGDGHNH